MHTYSVVWLEQIREDFELELTSSNPIVATNGQTLLHREINLTLTHEIGHLPINHIEAWTDSHHDEDGIMKDGGSGGRDNNYTPATAARFRKTHQWTRSENE